MCLTLRQGLALVSSLLDFCLRKGLLAGEDYGLVDSTGEPYDTFVEMVAVLNVCLEKIYAQTGER